MKQVMTFQQAALDPNRPLSITPRQWMYAVQAQMATQNELVDNTITRIASQKKQVITGDNCFQKIQLGLDQIVSGIKIMLQGLNDAKIVDLRPNQRAIANKVQDLVQTALSPYTVDIIEQLDKLQEE